MSGWIYRENRSKNDSVRTQIHRSCTLQVMSFCRPTKESISLSAYIFYNGFTHQCTTRGVINILFCCLQIGATLIHYHQDSDYRYEIYFVTGSRNGSGTTAHVGCEILGEEESSGPCYLLDTSRALFRRGDLNVFILSLPNPLGPIRGLRVWHDNDGKSPGWFLNRAMLRDCQTGDKWIFLSGMKSQRQIYLDLFGFIWRVGCMVIVHSRA